MSSSLESKDSKSKGLEPTGAESRTFSIYVLDCSRSMGDRLGQTKTAKLELAKAGIVATLSAAKDCNPKDKVGVLSVNTSLIGRIVINEVIPFGEISPMTNSKSIPYERIMLLRNEGGTALFDGIERALEILSESSSDSIRRIIVITDSRSNGTNQSSSILKSATRTRTRISFVILGNGKGKNFESFMTMAELTGGQFNMATTTQELEKAIAIPRLQKTSPSTEIEESTDFSPQTSDNSNDVQEIRHVLNPVTPKRKKAKTLDEVSASVEDLTREYAELEKSLMEGGTTQLQFTEKYSIIQYELAELRQSIRELRSKTSREMTELALVKDGAPGEFGLLGETSSRLVELERKLAEIQKNPLQ